MIEYILIKRGLYWRPNSSGYTNFLRDAGRYTFEEAEEAAGDDMTNYIPENQAEQFAPSCCPVTKRQELDRIGKEAIQKELESLRAHKAASDKIIAKTVEHLNFYKSYGYWESGSHSLLENLQEHLKVAL